MLLTYLGVTLASIQLRRKEVKAATKGFRIPGGPVVPLLAAATIAWLLSNLSKPEIIAIAVFIGLISAIYLLILLFKKKKSN